ncbi:hypothetical protein NDU88_002845 [Pleurodeles waltl]|uniref:Uncharacterized protein n=1 Tax=Pleurodeles waltl TaxID=8319 RepID=A0AAV7REM1_PLEWA|nr:hypothetical protein NDU88_002845 [Pleurodeles waltl]
MESFVERWIKDVLQPVGLSRVFFVECAHRALVAPPQPRAPPRAIISRLLNYKDRDCILQAARESDKAVFENSNISIYPDCINKVQDSRKGFLEVNAKLCAMNIRYMLFYLAHLKVLFGGKSHFFEHLEEVWRWLEMWDKVTPGRSGRTGLVAHCASGVEDPDWRTRGECQMEGTAEPSVDADNRIDIQQDGAMAVVVPGLADGLSGALNQGEARISADT